MRRAASLIVDSSAAVGVLSGEPDAEALSDALVSAQNRRMSAATLVELYVVVDAKRDPVRSARLDDPFRADLRLGSGFAGPRVRCIRCPP